MLTICSSTKHIFISVQCIAHADTPASYPPNGFQKHVTVQTLVMMVFLRPHVEPSLCTCISDRNRKNFYLLEIEFGSSYRPIRDPGGFHQDFLVIVSVSECVQPLTTTPMPTMHCLGSVEICICSTNLIFLF